MRLALDHVAIAARSLEEGADWLAARGLQADPGGRHPGMGTHNLLLGLGPGEYLELIAPDPDAGTAPAWFGLAGFDGPPRIAGWVLRADPLQAPPGTRIATARRGDLSWRITVPEAGQMPLAGACPMRIDWGRGPHPSARLPDRGWRLTRLALPPGALDAAPGLDDPRLAPSGPKGRMALTLSGPGGEVAL